MFGVVFTSLAIATGAIGAIPAGAAVTSAIVPTSIAADCSRDVTAALNAWIASVPDNSTLAFTANGCFRVDGTLIIHRRSGLTFQGNNATFRQVTDGTELVKPKLIRTRNVWSFEASAHLVVRNLTTFGANPHAGMGELAYSPRFEAQHAYLIEGTNDMLMDHVAAYDTYGDFVWVGPGTSNLTVRNSTFARNGRQGWSINGTNITFENNSITDTRRATIDIEPSSPTWISQNIWIRNNDVGPGRLFFFANVGSTAPMDNINIIGNRLHHKAFVIYASAVVSNRSNYHVIGNTSDGGVSGFGAAMVFRNIRGVEVRDNVIPLQWSHHLSGVALFRSSRVSITHNVFHGGDSVWRDKGGNIDVTQSANWIGPRPMALAAPTTTAGPTAVPTAVPTA